MRRRMRKKHSTLYTEEVDQGMVTSYLQLSWVIWIRVGR
jgi:hypothetical protein